MTVAATDVDAAFYEGLEGKTEDWKYRAVAGLVTRETYGNPHHLAWARAHGLSRAVTDDERAAWLYGFEWPDVELRVARTQLSDLLIGRMFRLHAQDTFEVALDIERHGAPRDTVTHELERAAHQEWVAVRSERGQVVFGGRLNRCGSADEVE